MVCGFVRPRKQIEQVEGELIELGFDSRIPKELKQDFYSELIYIAQRKNYNINWASNKYREKFGVWPRGLKDYPRIPSETTERWVKHRNIAWSKRQNKMRGL